MIELIKLDYSQELEEIDPQLLIGVGVPYTADKKIVAVVLKDFISEKLPEECNINEYEWIISVHHKNQIIIAELFNGNANYLTRMVISSILKGMEKSGLKSAIFPYPSPMFNKPTTFVVGFNNITNSIIIYDPDVKNIRVMDQHIDQYSIIFSYKKEIREIQISSLIRDSWLIHSSLIFKAKRKIAFLGKIKDSTIPISFHKKRNIIFDLDLLTKEVSKYRLNISEPAFVVGEVKGGIKTAISSNQVIFW
ncbi:MAG: hypothetical protein AAB696_02005 [Patescibacteria group bacterium]